MRCIACNTILRNCKYDLCPACIEATNEAEAQPFVSQIEVTEVYEEYN